MIGCKGNKVTSVKGQVVEGMSHLESDLAEAEVNEPQLLDLGDCKK